MRTRATISARTSTSRALIPRRAFLRGLGVAVGLPLLESMTARRAAGEEQRPPCRMAFLYVPNGIHMPDWTPKKEGADFDFPPTLEVLKPFAKDLLVLSGLTQDKARPNGDGPGDHARAAAAFLTGCQPFKTDGAGIRAGISVDQLAASRVGQHTRFPSLELGCDASAQSGNCDSGYSCAYSANISWRTPSTPMAKETNPRAVFERLFSGGAGGEEDRDRALRKLYRRSILDFVLEDASHLRARLGATDRRKLDEYLSAVREVEGRIERSEKADGEKAPGFRKPSGIPKDYGEHIRILCDLLVLAFRCDLTRVATFMLANEGSNRSYRSIDVPEGHHDLSHHGGDREKQAKIAAINRFHVSQLSHLLAGLKAEEEPGGTLLDHSLILYGSGLSDGNRHNHDDLPILLAGRGCGTVEPGRHIRYGKETPLANLYLSLLDRMDASAGTLGDSTGRLPHLYGRAMSF